MSAARSVFRMLSEEQIGVGEIMIRANRRTKKTLKSGMFDRPCYMSSWTRQQDCEPLQRRADPAHTRLRARPGKRSCSNAGRQFSPGILDGADYQETTLQLEPEDKTDLLHRWNCGGHERAKRIFGFDRLLQVAKRQRPEGEELLKKILDEVKKFCATPPSMMT